MRNSPRALTSWSLRKAPFIVAVMVGVASLSCIGPVQRANPRNPDADAIDQLVRDLGITEGVRTGQFQPCNMDAECPHPGTPGQCDETLHRCDTRCEADADCPRGSGNQDAQCVDGACVEVDIVSDTRCTTRRLQRTRELQDVSSLHVSGTVQAAPSTMGALYPGALLQSSAVAEGVYVEIPVPKGAVNLTTTFPTRGSSAAIMYQPSQTQYREVLDGWLSDAAALPGADLSIERSIVRSQDDLSYVLGATVGNERGAIAGTFSFSNRRIRTRMVLHVKQGFFRVDVEPFARPSDAVSWQTRAEEMRAITIGSPVYVSSVLYGRESFITLESYMTEEELGGALNLALGEANPQSISCECVDNNNDSTCDNCADTDHNLLCDRVNVMGQPISFTPVTGVGCAAYRQRRLMETTTVSAYLVGSRTAPMRIASMSELQQFLHDNAAFDIQHPGVPISYSLSYLSDNSLATMTVTGSYTDSECSKVGNEYQLRLVRIHQLHCDDGWFDGECEVYGNVEVQSYAYDSAGVARRVTQTLWSRAGNRHDPLNLDGGENYPSAAPTATSAISQVRFAHVPALGEPLRVRLQFAEYDRHSNDERYETPDGSGEITWTREMMLRGPRTVILRGEDTDGVELTFVLSPCTNGTCESIPPPY